jgi:hypothetical protein
MDIVISKKVERKFVVNQLAFDTYLDYWLLSNPKFVENGNKKRSDLLIVFNNVCIIISVKNYEFKGNHKILQQYNRKGKAN